VLRKGKTGGIMVSGKRRKEFTGLGTLSARVVVAAAVAYLSAGGSGSGSAAAGTSTNFSVGLTSS